MACLRGITPERGGAMQLTCPWLRAFAEMLFTARIECFLPLDGGGMRWG